MKTGFGPESIWAHARDSIFPPDSWSAAPSQVAACLRLAGITDASDVLDLPCGLGRHSLSLAAAGHRVVAVDAMPDYLVELRRRATLREERDGRPLAIETVQADMREFRRPESFDLLLNLYHSFGYFPDRAEDRLVLRHWRDSLRPGGVLVMDMMSREILAAIWKDSAFGRLPDGTIQLEERAVSEDWTWMTSRWTFVHDGEVREYDMSHRIYGGVDLRRELEDAGFDGVRLAGGFDGRPYGPGAQRLVVVAWRNERSGTHRLGAPRASDKVLSRR